MRIPDEFMLTHDIDWFFTFGGLSYHCASFGSIIPEGFNDLEYLMRCQLFVSNNIYFNPEQLVRIEENNVNIILGEISENQLRMLNNQERQNAYLRTFVEMAKKGFISCDCFHKPHSLPTLDYSRYLIIARPDNNDMHIKSNELNPIQEMKPELFQTLHINITD